ncbi:hypothetical protein R3P38DRAFT_3251242 [Favolaschia claudopus]|uniref:Uncharacterized protein n=1 Tax=Favolaschia claudopus TaxID=2862362 RepID=A0AAW0E938_9AGAR
MALNLTVSDQSPTWVYAPDREGSWQSVWSGSPDSSYDATHKTTNLPQGTSSHVTSTSGASVQIDFVGMAVSVYGSGTAGAYTTTLDSNSPVTGAPAGSMLATYGDLDGTKKHTLVLKATQAQSLSFSYATFTIREEGAAGPSNNTQTAVSTGANNAFTTNPFFSTSGDGFRNDHQDSGYTRIDSNSANAQITFTCSDTSALFIYGTTNYDHQTYSVELSPSAGASQGGARIFNGTSKWFVLDNLLFWEAGMDPTQKYQVKVTNLIPGGYMDLHSATMMKLPKIAPPSSSSSSSSSRSSTSSPNKSTPTPGPSDSATPSPSSGSSVGKTVGIAVAVVGALAAVALLLFCLRRRNILNRRQKRRMTIDGMVTPFGNAPSSPFVDAPHGKDSSVASSQNPISLNNFQTQPAAGYPTNNYGGGYPNNNNYGGGGYPNNNNNYNAYPPSHSYSSSESPSNSTQNLRVVGASPLNQEARYSDLSGSEDFNPYGGERQDSGLAYLRDSTYAASTVGGASTISGGMSRPQSSLIPVAGGSSGSTAAPAPQPYRRPEKGGPLPNDPSSRPFRQEVDAGRVVPEDDVLPPSYNPTWQQG